MGILDEGERQFIDLYMHMIGRSEVPRRFHFWSCMSLLAACVADRVWVKADIATKIYPNLYVFLVGPSGSGKEQAIKVVLKLVAEQQSKVNPYAGKMTGPAMWEYLSKSGVSEVEGRGKHKTVTTRNPCVYFVTEELGACVRSGDLGQDLIATMTAFYVRPPLMVDGTRQHGFVKLIDPCVNWLAGTTDEWMLRSVPKDAVEGGFVARVQVVRGQRNYAERYPRMIYPEDYEQVRAHLMSRIEDLLALEQGEFTLTDEAMAVHDAWYLNAKPPADSSLLPSFNRADTLIYKLALILAIAEWPGRESVNEDGEIVYDCKIHDRHIKEAISLWDDLVWDMPETMKMANANPQSQDVEIVRKVVKKEESVLRSVLMQKVASRGINKDRLDRALETLLAEESIEDHSEMGRGNKPRVWYTWEGGEG